MDNEDNKTAEAIALKVCGDPSQVRMTQVFLSSSPWPDQPLRDELGSWVADELGSNEGTLIFDEGSFPKCGTKSVGVARQYCGASGKLDNCQVAVYVAYAGNGGHALLDTRLYLHDCWTTDPARCRAAGVPEGVVFRTKPQLAFELLRHWRGRLRHHWVSFDEVYGRDPDFVGGLEELGERYIGAVPKDTHVWSPGPAGAAGRRGPSRAWRRENPRRGRSNRWRPPCRQRRGNGCRFARGARGCSTPSSPGCGWWPSATTCPVRTCGW